MTDYLAFFENLNETNHQPTSPQTPSYNCIAWAAEDQTRWWQPNVPFEMGFYWPPSAPNDMSASSLVAAFEAEGYSICSSGELMPNATKIALYRDEQNLWTHAARQLPTGKWTSKLGKMEDIQHDDVHAISGKAYGTFFAYMMKLT